jgi:hypothetical protein
MATSKAAGFLFVRDPPMKSGNDVTHPGDAD